MIANSIAPFVVPHQVTLGTWRRALSICRIAIDQTPPGLYRSFNDVDDDAFIDLLLRSIDIADRSFKYAKGDKVVRTDGMIEIMDLVKSQPRIEA